MNFHTLNKNNFHDYREKVACFYQIISRVVINTANVKQKQIIFFSRSWCNISKLKYFHFVQKIMAFSSRLGKFVLQRFESSLLCSCSFRQNSFKLQVRLCSSTKNNKPVTKRTYDVLDKMNRVNQYGIIGGVFHISLSTLCLGLFYVLFSK